MTGLRYQLKNVWRDKMCILTFLLPIAAAFAINLLSGAGFSSVYETSFGILSGDLREECIAWLESNGRVTVFDTTESLYDGVNDPATQMIGVLSDGDGIKTILSGDELRINTVIADTLPGLFEDRDTADVCGRTVIPAGGSSDSLKSLLIVITLVTAMFMGCTFNAMSMIGEKEDGITFINEILPISAADYMIQKIILGFAGGILSAAAAAAVCMRIEVRQLISFVCVLILSAFLAALTGLFIGRISGGLMIGIIYIKIFMLLYIAPPIMFYLTIPSDSTARIWTYLLPSSAAFYGLMDLQSGQTQGVWTALAALLVHCVVWTLIYLGANTLYGRYSHFYKGRSSTER